MNRKTRSITVSSMMSALSIVFLYLACVMPTGKAGFVAVSSLFIIVSVIECGIPYGLISYAAVSIIGFLLLPSKGEALLFLSFFGLYPVLKSLFERLRKRVYEWLSKTAFFSAVFFALWFAAGQLVFPAKLLSFSVILAYCICVAVFVIFDIGLSKLISYYIGHISKIIGHKNQKR